jgi:hypothetical protein
LAVGRENGGGGGGGGVGLVVPFITGTGNVKLKGDASRWLRFCVFG